MASGKVVLGAHIPALVNPVVFLVDTIEFDNHVGHLHSHPIHEVAGDEAETDSKVESAVINRNTEDGYILENLPELPTAGKDTEEVHATTRSGDSIGADE